MHKIAVTGKGGVGKSTITAALAVALSNSKKNVWVLDCDPDANLATILGYPYPEKLQPIAELKEIIKERTHAKGNGPAVFFKMNPQVDDIPSKFSVEHKGIHLMVMGKLKPAGSGCFCPENAFARSLVGHLLLKQNEIFLMDMEAGIEHLTRGTVKAVDVLLIVTEPSMAGIETAKRIILLAGSMGIKKVSVVANKVRSESDKEFIKQNLSGTRVIRFIAYNKVFEENRGVISDKTEFIIDEMKQMIPRLEE
ncbi:MAG: AAA family ATPase [Elusimicrobia bacterium]|nr:AAA family ATPase [Elusimicrobiota bacterium]